MQPPSRRAGTQRHRDEQRQASSDERVPRTSSAASSAGGAAQLAFRFSDLLSVPPRLGGATPNRARQERATAERAENEWLTADGYFRTRSASERNRTGQRPMLPERRCRRQTTRRASRRRFELRERRERESRSQGGMEDARSAGGCAPAVPAVTAASGCNPPVGAGAGHARHCSQSSGRHVAAEMPVTRASECEKRVAHIGRGGWRKTGRRMRKVAIV